MMGRMGSVNMRDLLDLQRKLQELEDPDKFVQSCAKRLAAQLLREVKPRTPLGQYPEESGKKGGKLRRGWTIGEIQKVGNTYKIEVINPVEYASYVEYGHRQEPGRYVPAIGKCLKERWVKGKFMMTLSEEEVRKKAPEILERKIEKYLKGCFK